jgi:hypothetical protein
LIVISDKALGYDHHIAFYKDLGFLADDPEKDAFWHRKAEYMHAVSILDAIRDTHIRATTLAQSAPGAAAVQLSFGVGRRTKFIWLSLQHLLKLVLPDRTVPLPHDDVEEAARNLNVIYIDIRGTLDNFASCLLDLFGTQKTRQLAGKNPSMVHLFNGELLKDSNFGEIGAFLSGFTDWNKELKTRRDPAAHRIPLSVPPALLDAASAGEYKAKWSEYVAASNAAVTDIGEGADGSSFFKKAEDLHDDLQRIGTFQPLFGHDPDNAFMKIYPTVPQDIGQLVKIARGLTAIISSKFA